MTNRTTRFLLLLIMFLALAVPVVSVQAQDEPEATPEIVVAPDENPSVIVVSNPNPPIPVEDGFSVWELVAVIGAIFAGSTFTLASLAWVFEKLRSNKDQMTTLEKAFNSVSQETLQIVYDAAKIGADAAKAALALTEVIKEASDGVPVKTKPPFTFAMTDSNGNTQIVYYDTGEALLGQTGRFQQHEDGTLSWHPESQPTG
jgi:hypothetical protein